MKHSDAGGRRRFSLDFKGMIGRMKRPGRAGKKGGRAKMSRPGLPVGRPGRILVFETVGTVLFGAVASCTLTSKVKLGAVAASSEAEFPAAVGEVLAKLRAGGVRILPKTAVLITPSATADILSLPVNPAKPRPPEQMREMVRWELEEAFLSSGDIWSIGALLQAMGAVSAEDRYDIEAAAKAAGRPATGPGGFQDAVDKAALDLCLGVQEALLDTEGDLAAGWTALDRESQEDGFAWYGAGISQEIRERWEKAFKAHKLKLAWIYPALGTGISQIPAVAKKPSKKEAASGLSKGWLLLDLRQEQFALFQGDGLGLRAKTAGNCPHGSPDFEAVSRAVSGGLTPETGAVYASCPVGLKEETAQALKAIEGLPDPVFLSPVGGSVSAGGSGACHAQAAVSMTSAARHALGRCRAQALVRIRGKEPGPPLWKSKTFWPWVLLAVLAAGMAGNDYYMRHKAKAAEWELELLDIEYDRKMKIKRLATQAANEAKKLEEELAQKEAELARQERLRYILDNVIRYRQTLIPGLLRAVGSAVTEEVVVNLVEENDDRAGFYVEGWALRDTEGQRFGKRLNEALAPWQYKVGNMEVTRSSGPMGLKGYLLKIRLAAVTDQDRAKGGEDD